MLTKVAFALEELRDRYHRDRMFGNGWFDRTFSLIAKLGLM